MNSKIVTGILGIAIAIMLCGCTLIPTEPGNTVPTQPLSSDLNTLLERSNALTNVHYIARGSQSSIDGTPADFTGEIWYKDQKIKATASTLLPLPMSLTTITKDGITYMKDPTSLEDKWIKIAQEGTSSKASTDTFDQALKEIKNATDLTVIGEERVGIYDTIIVQFSKQDPQYAINQKINTITISLSKENGMPLKKKTQLPDYNAFWEIISLDYNNVTEDTFNIDPSKITDLNFPSDQNNNIPDQNNDENNNDQNNDIPPILPGEDCNEKPTIVQTDLCKREKAALSKENIFYCSELVTLSKDDCLSKAGKALKDEEICKMVLDTKIADDCFNGITKTATSYSGCLQIKETALKATCLNEFGTANDNENACTDIPATTHEYILLRDNCLKAVALEKKDSKICSKISASISTQYMNRDECYWSIVQSNKEKSLCAKIFDKNMSDNCINYIAQNDKNAKFCLSITDKNLSNTCIQLIATATSDLGACSLLLDKNLSETCKINLLTQNKSISFCSSFPESKQRENCFFDYAKNFDSNDCKTAIDQNNNENCHIACKKITIDLSLADDCFSEIAIKMSISAYCNEIRASSMFKRNDCFDAIASANLDPSLCANIYNRAESYSQCFSNIAIKALDSEVCQMATRDYFGEEYSSKNLCLYYYAKAKASSADCNAIKDINLRKTCNTELGSGS